VEHLGVPLPDHQAAIPEPVSIDVRLIAGGVGVHRHPQAQPWHDLPCWLFSRVLHGRLTIETAEDGVHRLEPGRIFVVRPHVRRRFSSLSAPGYADRWVHARMLRNGVDPFAGHIVPLLPTGALAEALSEAISGLTSIGPGADSRRLASAARLLQAVETLPRMPAPERDVQRIGPVLHRLQAQPHLPADRASLARLVGLSPSRFAAVFRQATGQAPLAYLAERRLERAREFLAGSDAPVGAIAAAVGFDDPLHFSRRFRRRFGIGPAAWRRTISATGYGA
jgi:AraC family transcriptional regulator of arabinose operon